METQSYRIELGNVSYGLNNFEELFKEHWDEVAKNKSLMVLKPDRERYLGLEASGNLVTLFAYHGDEIVGYSCNIVSTHLHYSDLLCGYNDVLFIREDHRNSPLGLRLIKRTELELKNRGVKLILWHAKQNSTLDKILPRLKCDVQEIIYSKVL